jgi:hypothetical protein
MKNEFQNAHKPLNITLILAIVSITILLQACNSCQNDRTFGSPEDEIVVDIQNIDVKDALEKEINISDEDEQVNSSEEQKKEVRAAQEKRLEILSEEVKASTFKDKSDEQIITHLNKELELYKNTCDTAVFNGIKRLMNSDARIKVFRSSHVEFSHNYQTQMKETIMNCRKAS